MKNIFKYIILISLLCSSQLQAQGLVEQKLLSGILTRVDCSSKVCFPLLAPEGDLNLVNSKLFKYYFWTAYSIALYARLPDLQTQDVLADIPKRLTLTYHRDFEASDIIKAADKILKQNPEVNMQAISSQLNQINSLYVNIKEGDSYALQYMPSKGTSLFLNDQLLGVVEGSDFAKAYFGIWLSKYSLSSSLTEELLAGVKMR